MYDRLRIHQFLPTSRANGPGVRAVIWVQGCSLGCPGCYNPQTHSFEDGNWIAVEELVVQILNLENSIQGITISGGEPFQQPKALFTLLYKIKNQSTLSTLVFSGYSLVEIKLLSLGNKILENVDVLITGRYDEKKRVAHGLLGSSNKRLHLLSNRYSEQDIKSVPEAELFLTPDGEIINSGIQPLL